MSIIAERTFFCGFAVAKLYFASSFCCKFEGFDLASVMGTIAKGLLTAFTTGTPKVAFSFS